MGSWINKIVSKRKREIEIKKKPLRVWLCCEMSDDAIRKDKCWCRIL